MMMNISTNFGLKFGLKMFYRSVFSLWMLNALSSGFGHIINNV